MSRAARTWKNSASKAAECNSRRTFAKLTGGKIASKIANDFSRIAEYRIARTRGLSVGSLFPFSSSQANELRKSHLALSSFYVAP